ncbi:MAG: HDOD domain-containing protein, partial [Bradyrhizobium icense]
FHDIGKIIMNTMSKQQFQEVMQRCYNDGLSFADAERQVYSYTHSEVGGLVIKKWNFPISESLPPSCARAASRARRKG